MTKVNPENGIETKHDIFLGTYSNMMPFFVKNIQVFQWLSKPKFLSFMTKVNPSNGNKTKW